MVQDDQQLAHRDLVGCGIGALIICSSHPCQNANFLKLFYPLCLAFYSMEIKKIHLFKGECLLLKLVQSFSL